MVERLERIELAALDWLRQVHCGTLYDCEGARLGELLIMRLVPNVSVGVGVRRGSAERVAEYLVEDPSAARGRVLTRLLLYVSEVAGYIRAAATV